MFSYNTPVRGFSYDLPPKSNLIAAAGNDHDELKII